MNDIAQENKNAAKSNLRIGKDRRRRDITAGCVYSAGECRRDSERRSLLSTLELDTLLGKNTI